MKGKVVVIGSFIQDLAFYVDRFPVPGETARGRYEQSPGGKGFNQAVAASRAGAHVSLVTALGNDDFGYEAKKFLQKEQITLESFVAFEPSGTASILIEASGQNQIVVDLGANRKLSEQRIYSILQDIRSPNVIVTQLEHGENSQSSIAALSFYENYTHKPVRVLNPAPMGMNCFRLSDLKHVDILTPNETEMLCILGESPKDLEKLKNLDFLVKALPELEVPFIIITLGEEGCYLWSKATKTITTFESSPLVENVISSAGAGDCFTGCLAAYLSGVGNIENLNELSVHLPQAIKFATVAAGISVTRKGTAPAMPHWGEVIADLGELRWI